MEQVKAVRVNKSETGGKRRWHSRPALKRRKEDYEDTDQIRPRRHDAHHHFDRPGRRGKGVLPQQRHLRRPLLPLRFRFRGAQLRLQLRLRLSQPLRRLSLGACARILPQQWHLRGAPRPHRPQRDRDRQPQLPRLRHHPRAQILLWLVTNTSPAETPLKYWTKAMKALTKLALAVLLAASGFVGCTERTLEQAPTQPDRKSTR